VKSSIFYCTIW